ncbi:hypothetical protein FQN49_005847 [Arthroderma sp. PD_2]|nr:hypothetical protein FQN49_005847 [Arthroderma sp. PD_2]
MGRLSSKNYIRLHALFQVALAIYLTTSRETVSGTELVYKVRNDMRIDNIQPFNLPRSPFAYCGILLLSFALFDLTLAIKLPTLNHILAVAEFIHRQQLRQQQERQQRESLLRSQTPSPAPTPSTSRSRSSYTRPPSTRTPSSSSTSSSASDSSTSTELNDAALKITAEFSSLYRQLCILLITLRSWIFMVVSLRIYLSPDTEWGAASAAASATVAASSIPGTSTVGGSFATPFRNAAGKTVLWFDEGMLLSGSGLGTAAAVSGSGADVDDLKRKIVLGYGVLELMFSCWILFALRDEKRRAESHLRSVGVGLSADMVAALR